MKIGSNYGSINWFRKCHCTNSTLSLSFTHTLLFKLHRNIIRCECCALNLSSAQQVCCSTNDVHYGWSWPDRGANNKSKYMGPLLDQREAGSTEVPWCGYIKFPFIHKKCGGIGIVDNTYRALLMNELWLKLSTAIERSWNTIKNHTTHKNRNSIWSVAIPVIFDLIRAPRTFPTTTTTTTTMSKYKIYLANKSCDEQQQIGLLFAVLVQQTCKHVQCGFDWLSISMRSDHETVTQLT